MRKLLYGVVASVLAPAAVPAFIYNTAAGQDALFGRGLSPDTLLVRDLHPFDLPPNSTEIHIREP